jgi:NADH-quinone oxidoreductase subunit J
MDLQSFLFWVIAGITAGCALATVVTHNIVRAASWLLFTLAGTSGLFFLIGADLVGAVQLLVYVGGTLILVVFGVMLTAQGPFISMRTSSAEWAVSAATGISLLAVLVLATWPKVNLGANAINGKDLSKTEPAIANAPPRSTGESPASSPYTMVIGQGFTGVGVGPAHKTPRGIVRADYLLPFEIVSVHLLVVLIGAAYLARAKRRREGAS